MKRITLVFAVLILSLTVLCACGGSDIDGEYKQYLMQNNIATNYYSMTLKNGKFTLIEVNTMLEERTDKSICKGEFTFDAETGDISFTANGKTFSGTLKEGQLIFTYDYEVFVMS